MARKTMAGFAVVAALAFAACSQQGQSTKGSANSKAANNHDEKKDTPTALVRTADRSLTSGDFMANSRSITANKK